MKSIFAVVSIAATIMAITGYAQAQTPDSDQEHRIAAARSAIDDACLLGSQYELSTTGSAGVSIRKRGVAGEVTVRSSEAKGNPGYLDEKLRLIADEKTRECMMKYLPRLLDVLLGPSQRSNASTRFPSTVLGFAYYAPRSSETDVTGYLKSGVWKFSIKGPSYVVAFDRYVLRTFFDENHKVRKGEIISPQLMGDWKFFAPTKAADCPLVDRIDEKVEFERTMLPARHVVGSDPYITRILPHEIEAYYSRPLNAVETRSTTVIIKTYPTDLQVQAESMPVLPKEPLVFRWAEVGLNEYIVRISTFYRQAFAGQSPPKTNDDLLWTTQGPVWEIAPGDAKGMGQRTCAFDMVIEPRTFTAGSP